MLTRVEKARNGEVTDVMKYISEKEGIGIEPLRDAIASGQIVIPLNNRKNIKNPCAIGKGVSIKINANIGTSRDSSGISEELKKLQVCVDFGADTVMDLSTGPDITQVRKAIIKASQIPVGTVPVYQAVADNFTKNNKLEDILAKTMIDSFKTQAEDGVDFMTIHSGITKQHLPLILKSGRSLGVVSRGGAILVNWMNKTKQENPYYEYFDEILDVAREYDVTLSLGDGLRPGSILDATDEIQIGELRVLADLAKRCHEAGVSVMIEGPGHVPLNQIEYNMRIQKELCGEIPFYILGPLGTDCAVGYDHIAAAIGGSWAAYFGANFLCYVTPAEHVSLPDLDDVKEGVIASKIAAHCADIALGNNKAIQRDKLMTQARKIRDWTSQCAASFDPEKFKEYKERVKTNSSDVCSMCSDLCSMKIFQEA